MAVERLQKIIARSGIASRRGAEALISDGRVRVNGRIVTELGVKADGRADKIEVDGKRIVSEELVYFLFHKPREVISTLSDPQGRDTVADLTKRIPQRVYPVGRLDYHTSGALLLSNDGRFSEALLRPRVRVPKIYRVKVNKHLTIDDLEHLRNGVTLDDGYQTQPAELFVEREEANFTVINLTLTEGKNRQVHRMIEAIDHRVQRLHRLSMAGLDVLTIRPGDYRPLSKKELTKIKEKYVKPYEAWQRGRKKEATFADFEEPEDFAQPEF